MGTERTGLSNRTREVIVEAASELMLEVGPSRLTHRNVAARAGVSVGSTTKYFDSIVNLRRQALEFCVAKGKAEAQRCAEELARAENPVTAGTELLVSYVSDPQRVASELSLVAAAAEGGDPDLRRLATSWTVSFVEALGPRCGTAAAWALATFIDGAIIHAALYDEPLDSAIVEQALQALLRTGEENA